MDVGSIPPGKWNLVVKLSSLKDVDVQLFDTESEECPEGKAIIAYSETKGCGQGLLGNNDGSAESVEYKGMKISYSGYYGVDGVVGKEYIKIEGEVLTTLVMKAFAFEAGSAAIEYAWGYTQTSCCLGILPCGPFQFSAEVPEGATVEIGDIIVGKKDLRVELRSQKDVDVQLYDVGDEARTRCGDEGQAIIAYFEGDNACKKGSLGNNEGEEEGTKYKSLNFTCSGYNGVEGEYGNEFIQIEGVTNNVLNMKAFGYAAGVAEITYQFYENVPAEEVPKNPSVHWMAKRNNKNSKTNVFTDVPDDTIIARRGQSFKVLVFAGANGAGIVENDISANITGKVAAEAFIGEPRGKEVEFTVGDYPSDQVSFEVKKEGDNRFYVTGTLAPTASAGDFELSVTINHQTARKSMRLKSATQLIVLFNPYDSRDDVYATSSNLAEYIENNDGLVWQGLSDNNNGFSWSYDQFKFSNLIVALDRMFRMPVADRGNLVLVSRHLTYSIGADVCYGKWGEGSYTTGRPSGGYVVLDVTQLCVRPRRSISPMRNQLAY